MFHAAHIGVEKISWPAKHLGGAWPARFKHLLSDPTLLQTFATTLILLKCKLKKKHMLTYKGGVSVLGALKILALP